MDVRLYISVPSNRHWQGKFGAALTCLVSQLTGHGIAGHNLKDFFLRAYGQSSCLSIARQSFVDEMIEKGFTHWLSLDDDMSFPMDIVDRLIAHDKDVVSINARHKQDVLKGSLVGLDGQSVDSTGRTGLEELKTMGGAIFLARIDAFRHVPKPHFQVIWSQDHNTYISEDVHFAALIRAHGVKLWCDHDTSQLVSHIGDYEYMWPKVEQVKLRAVA